MRKPKCNIDNTNIFDVNHFRNLWQAEDRLINLKQFPDFCLARSESEKKCSFASVFSMTTWFRLDNKNGPFKYNDHIKKFERPD